MIRIIDYKDIDRAEILDRKENVFNVADTVSEIIKTVREKGDSALFAFCEKFDKVKLDSLFVSEEEQEALIAKVPDELKAAIDEAAENIYEFHKKQLQNSWMMNQ